MEAAKVRTGSIARLSIAFLKFHGLKRGIVNRMTEQAAGYIRWEEKLLKGTLKILSKNMVCPASGRA